MNHLAELLGRVRDRAEHETEALAPCVSEQDSVAAEQTLGFSLPSPLRLLYRHVANGGFGPRYTLLPLVGIGRTVITEHGPLRDARTAHWPHGVLPILDWGCGMYAAVDCLDPTAPVLVFEPNADPDDWADAWFLDSPSLAQRPGGHGGCARAGAPARRRTAARDRRLSMDCGQSTGRG